MVISKSYARLVETEKINPHHWSLITGVIITCSTIIALGILYCILKCVFKKCPCPSIKIQCCKRTEADPEQPGSQRDRDAEDQRFMRRVRDVLTRGRQFGAPNPALFQQDHQQLRPLGHTYSAYQSSSAPPLPLN